MGGVVSAMVARQDVARNLTNALVFNLSMMYRRPANKSLQRRILHQMINSTEI